MHVSILYNIGRPVIGFHLFFLLDCWASKLIKKIATLALLQHAACKVTTKYNVVEV